MSNYVESRGPSLKHSRELERADNLHHIRVYRHSDSTPVNPRWLVEHHTSENDSHPTEHTFDDGKKLLAHVAEHTAVPDEDEQERNA